MVVQGFGNVGTHVARYLEERGAVLVGASDLDGTVYDKDGINVRELTEIKHRLLGFLNCHSETGVIVLKQHVDHISLSLIERKGLDDERKVSGHVVGAEKRPGHTT